MAAIGITYLSIKDETGGAPPELDIDQLIQAPEGVRTTWQDLKGKVVVLEYWASW